MSENDTVTVSPFWRTEEERSTGPSVRGGAVVVAVVGICPTAAVWLVETGVRTAAVPPEELADGVQAVRGVLEVPV